MTNGWNPQTGEEWFRWMEHRMREQERSAGQRPEWADGSDDPNVIDASVWPGVIDPDTVSAPVLDEGPVVENPEQPAIGTAPPDETEVGGFPGDTHNEFDDQPPRAPSKPIAVSRLGVHEVTWDGLAEGSEVMDEDFAYLAVHRSQEMADFVPTDDTRFDVLRAPGSVVVTGTDYGSVWYYRFVAFDTSDNASEPSYPSDAVTTVALVDTDIIGEVINGAHIVDGSLVASDKIVANSITSAELAALSVTAGKIAANAVTATTIAAGAVTAVKIAATAIDGMTITGAFIRTAASGKRWELKSSPANKLLAYSGLGTETAAGYLEIDTNVFGTGSQLDIAPSAIGGVSPPNISMQTYGPSDGSERLIELDGTQITVIAPTIIASGRVQSDTTTGDIARTRSPGAMIRKTDTPTITNATYTLINWSGHYNAANVDNTVWAAADPSRFVAPVSGRYSIGGSVIFAANATGYRLVNMRMNAGGATGGGTSVLYWSIPAVPTTVSALPIALTDFYMDAGDYVEFFANQSSGGALGVGNAGGAISTMSMSFIGPV